jgi:hypothetical protein
MIAEKTTKTTTTTITITIISFYHECDILFLSFQQLLFVKKTGADGPPRQHSFSTKFLYIVLPKKLAQSMLSQY